MAPKRSTRKTAKKDPPKKKGRAGKGKKKAIKEPVPPSPTSSLKDSNANDENIAPPPIKEDQPRGRRTRAKKQVNYQVDSDTDPCSDDESSDEEDVAPPAKKTQNKRGKKAAAAAVQAKKKQKMVRSSPSVRPPDRSSPRGIAGREEENSPEDWRVSVAQDY